MLLMFSTLPPTPDRRAPVQSKLEGGSGRYDRPGGTDGTPTRPVRILHTSDWHVGRAIRGRSRADEHRQVLGEIASIAGEARADLVLVAGDLFDVAAPTPEAERIVYRALLDLAEVAPVLVVAGNHDHPRRLQAVAPLLELGRVQVTSSLIRPDEGGLIDLRDLGVRVAMLPWVSQRGIVRADELMSLDPDDHGGRFADRMRAVIAALCAPMTNDTVNLVLGHVMVAGGDAGGGEREAHLFGYTVPASAFPGSVSYVALGHLHRTQRVPAPAPVWYAGSPLQLDFGETENRSAVLVVEAEPGLPVSVEERPLESGRRLVRLRGTLAQVAAGAGETGDAYLKIELDEPARVGLADEVRHLFPEAVDVVIARREEPRPEARPARLGRPARDLFREYLEAKRVDDDRLVLLFEELLEAAHET